MVINPHRPVLAAPGQPITSQAWNVIVNAINTLTQYLEESEATSARVRLTNTGIPPESVRVTAVRDDGLSYQAVAPIAPATDFVFAGLKAGAYRIIAQAPGFKPGSKDAAVPTQDAVVSITLERDGALMPLVFGLALQTALARLKEAGIAVSRVVDAAGRDVPPAKPPSESKDLPVLVQFPAPGVPVPPEQSAQLVIAAVLQAEAAIEMPSLTGLTQAEAQKALEAIGLRLGKVSARTGKRI